MAPDSASPVRRGGSEVVQPGDRHAGPGRHRTASRSARHGASAVRMRARVERRLRGYGATAIRPGDRRHLFFRSSGIAPLGGLVRNRS